MKRVPLHLCEHPREPVAAQRQPKGFVAVNVGAADAYVTRHPPEPHCQAGERSPDSGGIGADFEDIHTLRVANNDG